MILMIVHVNFVCWMLSLRNGFGLYFIDIIFLNLESFQMEFYDKLQLEKVNLKKLDESRIKKNKNELRKIGNNNNNNSNRNENKNQR